MKKNADGQFTGHFTHPIFGKCTLRRDGVVQTARNTPRANTTLSQYLRNARLRNAAALWNHLKPLYLDEFFTGVTPYTRISSDASSTPGLYGMIKQQKESNQCTIAPILVSWGDILPVRYDSTFGCTDISIGNHRLDETTLFADFCRWIVENNPAFCYGDKLSLIYVQQAYKQNNPYVATKKCGIILEDEYKFGDTLAELCPELFNLLASVEVDVDEYALTLDPDEKMCAFAFIHSGWRCGKIENSTQHLICRFDPWELQLPLLKNEFKSIGGIIKDSDFLTRENGVLCKKFGYSANQTQVEN